MLTLISTKHDESKSSYEAHYEIKHNTEKFNTTLTADLYLTVNDHTGEVSAKIDVAPVPAKDMDHMRSEVARHLERLAMGLREPIKERFTFPVYDKDWDEIKRLNDEEHLNNSQTEEGTD